MNALSTLSRIQMHSQWTLKIVMSVHWESVYFALWCRSNNERVITTLSQIYPNFAAAFVSFWVDVNGESKNSEGRESTNNKLLSEILNAGFENVDGNLSKSNDFGPN
jgi:hypothetical protein